jgi:hypothetical protein
MITAVDTDDFLGILVPNPQVLPVPGSIAGRSAQQGRLRPEEVRYNHAMFTGETSGRPALCTNKDCRREYWYYPVGGFDSLGEPIPPTSAPKYCRTCGRPVISACPLCKRPLDIIPTLDEPYCVECGVDLLSVEVVPEPPGRELTR